MNDTNIYLKRINSLRELMKKQFLDALIIGSKDEFLNEYVNKSRCPRTYVSGFDGTAGELLITLDKAYLLVDGRYHTQADNQVDKSIFQIEKVGIDEEGNRIKELVHERFIKLFDQLSEDKNFVIGYDPKQFSVAMLNYFRQEIQKNSSTCVLTAIYKSLVDEIREHKAPDIISRVYKVPIEISGMSSAQKLKLIRDEMTKLNTTAIFISKLDELAYITNLRGHEINFNSTFKGYAFISLQDAFIFSDVNKFDCKNLTKLNDCFDVLPFEELDNTLDSYIKRSSIPFQIGYDPSNTTCAILDKLNRLIHKNCKLVVMDQNPIKILKAIKNNAELKHMKHCFNKADKVFNEVINWVNQSVCQDKQISELDIKNKVIETFKIYGSSDLSFEIIAAIADNTAIVHYTESSNKKIAEINDLILIDSGAYFEGGYATDLTRTFVAGGEEAIPSNRQKKLYTIVLKAAIKGLTAELPLNSTGEHLDNIVRSSIITAGYDYNHGTGHGVGISVHEAPPTISYGPNGVFRLQENMVFSIEPGIYIEDWGGIRFENIATLKKHSNPDKAARGWLEVECLTFAPVDENLVDTSMLNPKEINFLNSYKERFDQISRES